MGKRKFGIALRERKPHGMAFMIKLTVVATVACLLAVVAVVMGLNLVTGLGVGDIKEESFEIFNGEQLVACLKANTTLKDLGKDKKYTLKNRIELTPAQAEELAYGNEDGSFAGVSLYGRLEGNGHTILLKESEDSKEPLYLTAPLIASVKGSGSIDGVAFEGFRFRAQKGSGVALVGMNNGKLENIRLRSTEVSVPREEAHNAPDGTAVSALCVYNFGSISNVVVDALYHTPGITEDNSDYWNCAMGTLVAANEGGQVKKSIVHVAFDPDTPFLVLTSDRTARNSRVGYVIGTWRNESNISDIVLVSEGGKELYERKAHDFYGFRAGKGVVQKDYAALPAEISGWTALWKIDVEDGLPDLPNDKVPAENGQQA